MYGNMRFNKKRLKRQKNLLEKILQGEIKNGKGTTEAIRSNG